MDYVKTMKKRPYTKNVLVVNTGDFFYGEVMHTVFKWTVTAKLAKQMPYDALALGDKEFQDGLEGLLPFMRSLAPNLFVCTNMNFSNFNVTIRDELAKLCPRHRILTIGNKRVGILSYLTPNTMTPLKVSELQLEDEIEALTREVVVLRENGIKLFVALGHSGYERDQQVARHVPSLDVIVGGHSHTLLWPDPFSHQVAGVPPDPKDASAVRGPYPTVVVQPSGRRVLLLHAFFGGKYVGNINVTFNADDEIKDWWPQPKLLEESMPEDPVTKSVLDDFQQRMENSSHNVIGHSLVQLVGRAAMCRQQECNLGNLMADAMLWALRSFAPDVPMRRPVIALVDAGLIRNNIQLGPVTPRMLTEALSWRNLIDVIVINGSTLLAALEHGASAVERRLGRFLQVAGLSYHINMSRPAHRQRVSNVNVLCADCMVPDSQPLNTSRLYHVAVPNYMAGGGDGFHMFAQPIERQRFGILDIDLLHNYISQTSPVYSIVESRVTIFYPPDDELQSQASAGGRSNRLATVQLWLLLTITLLVSTTRAAAAH